MEIFLIIASGFLLGMANGMGDIIRDCSLTCNVGYQFVPVPLMTIAFLTVPVAATQVRMQAKASAARWQIMTTIAAGLFFACFRFLTYKLFQAEEFSRGDAGRHEFWLETIRSTYIVYFVALELVFVLLWANLFVRVGHLFSGPDTARGMRYAAASIMAGGLFGSWFSGAAAPLLMDGLGGRFESIRDHFMFVIAGAIFLDLPLVIAAERRFLAGTAASPDVEKKKLTWSESWNWIRTDRKIARLAPLFFAAGASLVILDYFFYWIIGEQGESSATGFVEFFSNFYIYLYSFSLIVLSFGAERIIRKFGLLSALLVLPLALFFGAAIFLFYKLLAVIYIVQIMKEGLSDSLHEAAAEKLLARVEPDRLGAIKLLLDGVVTRAGVVFAAGAIILMTFVLGLPEIWTAGILLVTVTVWIASTLAVRQNVL